MKPSREELEELKESGFNVSENIDIDIDVDNLTKEQILDEELFRTLFALKPAEQIKQNIKIKERAKKVGIKARDYNDMYKLYKSKYAQPAKMQENRLTNFTDAPCVLKCGEWICEDDGVYKLVVTNNIPTKIVACPHPIMPIERLINVETKTQKVKLTFFRDKKWQYITVERSVLGNKTSIIQLSDRGIEVDSENAKNLVSYISNMISLNDNDEDNEDNEEDENKNNGILMNYCTDRLGWIGDKFIPYADKIKYDGDIAFENVYENIKEEGSYEEWKKVCRQIRNKSKIAHILLATSFSSVLNKKLGVLPFIVHIWGGTGTGKTVGLMLAMSVWGDPNMGKLVRTLNATQVALARYASFIHDIPFAGDELQIIKSKWDNFDNLIMYLTEGIDRSRGKAYGGVDVLKEWNCCFIFTGEEPITKSASGGGTKNRVIEIEATEKIIEDGNFISNFVKKNYGYAGKEFIKNIPNQKELQKKYNEIFKNIINMDKTDITDKQAMAMAVILLADEISTELIFKDEKLTIEDIKGWLTSAKEVDVSTRAYDWTMDWISQNVNKFKENEIGTGEIWGKYIEDEKVYLVNKSIYVKALREEGFDFNSIIRKFAEKGQILKNSQEKFSHQTSIGGIKANYIKFDLDYENKKKQEQKQIKIDGLPF